MKLVLWGSRRQAQLNGTSIGDLFLIIDREDGVVIAMTIVLRRETVSPFIL